jgi:hypothetical protein
VGHDRQARVEILPDEQRAAVQNIQYELEEQAPVRLVVYDVAGREVERLVNQVQPAGRHVAPWDTSRRARGIYFYRLDVGSASLTGKMIVR